ncbi:hypothetical protein FPV67DRAFT_1677808 [Lyophyllum atratum]|nr:hypothetical protein FPV67DRAFT_1677808 [Lyophyllum atratum]
MPQRRTIWQKQQSLDNLCRINGHQTKSANARPDTYLLHHEVQKLTRKLTQEQIIRSDLATRLRNMVKREARAKKVNSDLREQRWRTLHTVRVQKSRTVIQKENTVRKALVRAKSAPKEVYLKEKGVLKEDFRVALRELASCNVPVKKISGVLEKALEAGGMVLKDSVSARTVSRVVKEGGVASDIQLAYEIKESKDQKKLARILLQWKLDAIRVLEGRRFMENAALEDLLPVIMEENAKKIERAGGMGTWNTLPEEEQQRRDAETCEMLCAQFGETVWEKYSEEERRAASLFVWAGCCMHKDQNSVKYGADRMAKFWEGQKLTGPVKLMNRANAAAARAGPSKAQENAIEASQGGAVKLTSLAGAVFQNKDDKKGQQDTYQLFFEQSLRFGSHGEAAGELLVHLPLFLEFLMLVCNKKENWSLNHMESNVFKALQDVPTLTELAVLALYALVISRPYMQIVHAPGDTAITLGPLHEKVHTHCAGIIAKPALLLAADASFETATLDGKNWVRPEVFYAVQQIAPQLPHLEGCLVAFFEGALDAWNRFSREFHEDETIANLTEEEKQCLFIPATNDANEGLLGQRRRDSRRAPNTTVSYLNARTKYKMNDTKNFMQSKLGATDLAFVQKRAREQDASGEDRRQRQTQALHDQNMVAVKRTRDDDIHRKREEFEREIDAVVPLLNVNTLRAKLHDRTFTNTLIIQQVNWHRRYSKAVILRSLVAKMKREDKLTHLIVLAEAYNKLPVTTACADWEEREAAEEDDGVLMIEA